MDYMLFANGIEGIFFSKIAIFSPLAYILTIMLLNLGGDSNF